MFLSSSSYFPHSLCAIVFFSLEIYGKQVLFLHARVSYLFCPSFSDPSYCCFPRNVLEKQTLQFTPLARAVEPDTRLATSISVGACQRRRFWTEIHQWFGRIYFYKKYFPLIWQTVVYRKLKLTIRLGNPTLWRKTTKQMSNNDDCEPSAPPPLSLLTVRNFSSFLFPNGADFRRQQIQKYIRQQQLPLPTYLCALCGENRGSEREE